MLVGLDSNAFKLIRSGRRVAQAVSAAPLLRFKYYI